MEQSRFQFTNPRIEKIDFRVNTKKSDLEDMSVRIDVKSEVNAENKSAIVRMNLIVGELDSASGALMNSLYFNGIIVADFHWEDSLSDPERLLKVSGGTVLLSYIRPILATLTMQAGLKPLNLPFVDFTK